MTTTTICRNLVQAYRKDGIELDQINVQFATSGLYAVEVVERGSTEPERYFVVVEQDSSVGESSRPSGTSSSRSERK